MVRDATLLELFFQDLAVLLMNRQIKSADVFAGVVIPTQTTSNTCTARAISSSCWRRSGTVIP